MSKTYFGQTSSEYDRSPFGCANDLDFCKGLESGTYNRDSGGLQVSFNTLKDRVERRHGVASQSTLAVGDFIELFDVPTYAALTHLSVMHDCDTKGFKFDLEVADVSGTWTARVATARAGLLAFHDVEVGTTVTNGTSAAALVNIGATQGRDMFHFAPAPRNNHKAVIRLKVTAIPAGANVGFNVYKLNLDFFAKFDKYASCPQCDPCEGAYDKDAVTAVS
jgi:hypothetical protein